MNIGKQRGSMLLDVLIFSGILAIIAVAGLPALERANDEQISMAYVEGAMRVQRASARYYRINDAWPANANVLVADGLLDAGEELDPWGNIYVLAVIGDDLSLQSDMQEPRYLSYAQGELSRPQVAGNVLTSLIDPPGEEASHDALYALNGSRPLEGTMDADGNDISDVGVLSAASVSATGTVTGTRFNDRNNANKFVDPSSRSELTTLDVESIRDQNNTGYTWDGSGTSRMNYADLNVARLRSSYTEGGGGTTKLVGTTSTGELMSCVSGRWTKAGGASQTCGGNSQNGWCDTGDLRKVWGRIRCSGTGNRNFTMNRGFSNSSSYQLTAYPDASHGHVSSSAVYARKVNGSVFRGYCASTAYHYTYIAHGLI